MQKNVAGQKYTVFAFDATDGSPKTGDALNITANLRRDGVQDAIADTNPTETERGQYEFDLEQGETNADYIAIAPNSTTANIEVIGMPMGLWTTAPNFNTLGIESGRMDVGKWLGTAVTLSTGNQPDVNVDRIDDVVVSTIATDGKLHVLDGSGGALSTAYKLRAYVRLLARSDNGPTNDQATELNEINANDGAGGGDFDVGDTLEAADASLATIDGRLDTEIDYIVDRVDKLTKALLMVSTATIKTANRTTTSCEMLIGSTENDAYIGMKVVLETEAGKFVSRTITDYVGASKTVTWTPAIANTPIDSGSIFIVHGDTQINPLVTVVDTVVDNLPTSDKLLAYIQLLARKDSAIASDRSTELNAINANEGSGGGSYSNQVEALEAIRDALVDSNPQNHSATANNESGNTTLDGGTYANTTADNGSYYQTGPGVAVGGFGLDCDLTFNIGTGRVPLVATVDAKFSSGGQRTVQVWAYDYMASAYVQISNTATDFGNSASDSTYQYAMPQNMVQISDGEVKIRFTSTSETITDVFNADLVRVSSVAQEAAGLTNDAIQQAVWARADSGHDHDTLGHALSSMFIVDALVVSVTSTTQFIIDTGVANNDAFNGSLVQITDITDGHHETRRIVDYIGNTKEVFLDRALSFTPVAGDHVHVMGTGYGNVNVTHVGATAQTALDINDILDDTADLQTNQGAWATVTGRAPAGEYNTEMARITADVATEAKQDTIDTVVDAIKTITDNLPNSGALTGISGKTDNLPADPASETNVNANETKIDTIDGIVDSILIDTAVIGVLGVGLSNIPWNASWDAEVQSEVADALAVYDPPTKSEMDTAHALLATPTQVNTEVVDALATDTYAEPSQGAPGATISIANKIGFLYTAFKNKTISNSTGAIIYADNGTTELFKFLHSDDGSDYTRGEMISGV